MCVLSPFAVFKPCVCCRVFGDDIQGRDCGDEASRWFTRYLGAQKTFRLVHYEPQMRARRPVESEPLFPQYEVKRRMCRSLRWSVVPDFDAVVLYVKLSFLKCSSFTTFYLILKVKPNKSFL